MYAYLCTILFLTFYFIFSDKSYQNSFFFYMSTLNYMMHVQVMG